MEFGLAVPLRATKHYDEWMGQGELGDVARMAEESGFGMVAMTEHPFPDDAFVAQGGHHTLDLFVALSFMAAVTTRVKLLTYVCWSPASGTHT